MTERQEIIERLNGLELEGGSHEMLSAICKAVLPHGDAWTLRRCADLRDRLVRLLGEADTAPSDGRITNEVRRDIDACTQSGEMFDTVFIVKSALLCDLDRIDAAHDEAIKSVMNDALYHANDKDMADLGWYRALDEDNVPWRIGDRDEYGNEVVSIRIAEQGHFYFTVDGGLPCRANIHSHYHAPTVEDVLTEFAAKLIERGELTNGAAQTIAEYAAKLRLADDGKEQ